MSENFQEDLAQRIYSNPKFHQDYCTLLKNQFLRFSKDLEKNDQPDIKIIKRLAESIIILATSTNALHRRTAFEVTTTLFENTSNIFPKLGDITRLVCTRLGNIPAINLIGDSLNALPVAMAVESEVAIQENTIKVDGRLLKLTETQKEALTFLTNGDSLSLSAPTSAGKSFLITNFVASSFIKNNEYSAVVVVPTRALIRQFSEDFHHTFSLYQQENTEKLNKVELVTSTNQEPESLSQKTLFILTQERLQSILFNWKIAPKFDLLVVDESQKIADAKRGIILEDTITELISKQKDIQTVFLSPLTSNPSFLFEAVNFPDSKRQSTINSTFSPVAQHIYSVKTNIENKSNLTISRMDINSETKILDLKTYLPIPSKKSERVASIAVILGSGMGNILYASGPQEAEKIALAISRNTNIPPIDSDFINNTIESLKEFIHEDYYLIECLRKGAAYHFSAMPDIAKVSVEELFRENKISYISCTSTLLEGVNLPAKNIFIDSPKLGTEKMDTGSFWNLAGRAGRLMKDLSGNVYCINAKDWGMDLLERKKEYEIESSLTKTLKSDLLVNYISELNPEENRESFEQATNSLLFKYLEKGRDSIDDLIRNRVSLIQKEKLIDRIENIAKSITLPVKLLKKNKGIDARLQERFVDQLKLMSDHSLYAIVPPKPFHPHYYNLLSYIFMLCDRYLILENRGRSYKYFALIATQWIHENHLRDMIMSAIVYKKSKGDANVDINKIISKLIKDLNKELRFHYVKTTKCFCDLIQFELERRKAPQDIINSADFGLPNYLELGMYRKETIQLHNSGLSRTTSIVVNSYCHQKGVTGDILAWLKPRVHEIKTLPLPCKAELVRFLG